MTRRECILISDIKEFVYDVIRQYTEDISVLFNILKNETRYGVLVISLKVNDIPRQENIQVNLYDTDNTDLYDVNVWRECDGLIWFDSDLQRDIKNTIDDIVLQE